MGIQDKTDPNAEAALRMTSGIVAVGLLFETLLVMSLAIG